LRLDVIFYKRNWRFSKILEEFVLRFVHINRLK
jgi:hypothetical protein